MTAGKGVQHSEMFPLLKKEEDNPLELFQIWLNLPKKNKMVDPHFKMLWGAQIPRVMRKDLSGKQTEVEVIAGKLFEYTAPAPPPDSWAADPANEVAIWLITLQPGAAWIVPPASAGVNRSLYFYAGTSLIADGESFSRHQALEVKADVPLRVINGPALSRILLLQGGPIGEPVVQYGPFVGNSQQDIQQAYADYQKTQYGGWPWPSYENVHPRERTRFAKYPDGHEEVPVEP